MTAYDRAAEGLLARFRREEAALHAEGYLTVVEAAALLSVTRDTVSEMSIDGRLHAVRWEHRWVTRPEWIAEVPCKRAAAAKWRRRAPGNHPAGAPGAYHPRDAARGAGRCRCAGARGVADPG